jgi:hypothetical protein
MISHFHFLEIATGSLCPVTHCAPSSQARIQDYFAGRGPTPGADPEIWLEGLDQVSTGAATGVWGPAQKNKNAISGQSWSALPACLPRSMALPSDRPADWSGRPTYLFEGFWTVMFAIYSRMWYVPPQRCCFDDNIPKLSDFDSYKSKCLYIIVTKQWAELLFGIHMHGMFMNGTRIRNKIRQTSFRSWYGLVPDKNLSEVWMSHVILVAIVFSVFIARHGAFNPFSTAPLLQIPLHLLKHGCVHSYAITSRTKQAVYTKTANFNLTQSGVTSDLTLTVSCVLNTEAKLHGHCLGGRLQEWVENKRSVNFHRFGLGNAGGSIDSRVGDLCSERLLATVWTKKVSRFAVERGVAYIAIYLIEKRAQTDLLYLKFNYLSFALGFESIGQLISALWTKIGSKVERLIIK